MREQALPRQAQVILTATMHDVGIRCVDMTFGLLRFQLHFTCSGTLFLSFKVRAISEARKWFSVVVIFKIEVARDIYVTKQRISTSLGVCWLLGCSRRAPSAALRLLTVACAWSALPRGSKLSLRRLPVAQTQCPSTSRRPSLKSPCRLQSCPAQELSAT